MVELPFWSQITGRCLELFATRQFTYVETWFLTPRHLEVCISPRRIRITASMTAEEFQAQCHEVWFDVLGAPSRLQFALVQPSPDTFRATCAHVLIGQELLDQHRCILVKCPSWPPLAKHRAVLTRQQDSVIQIFQTAQHDVARSPPPWHAFLRLVDHMDWHLPIWSTHDRPILMSGMFLVGDVRRDDDDESSADGTSRSADFAHDEDAASPHLSEDSTCAPSDSSTGSLTEVDLSDESSMVSGPPLLYAAVGHSAPAPLQEPVDLTQDGEDIVTQDWDSIMEAVSSVVFNEDSSPPWVAITFGLGLTDLGRRDCQFHPRHIHLLLENIHALWADHARCGTLKVHYVRPQPELDCDSPYIVLIVEVQISGMIAATPEAVVLTQVTADEPGIVHSSLRAHRLSLPVLLGPLLQHLALDQHCLPVRLREVTVSHNTRVVPLDRTIGMTSGELWQIHVHAFPTAVLRLAPLLHNAERMFMAIHRFHARATGAEVPTFPCFAHGIAPDNQPLGMRSWSVSPHAVEDPEWIHHFLHLWPFHRLGASLGFAFSVSNPPDGLNDASLELHFVLDYSNDRDHVPVLIHQTLLAHLDDADHQQYLAVRVPRMADQTALGLVVAQDPFWHFADVPTVVTHEGRPVAQPLVPWVHSDVLATTFVVQTRLEILHALFETHHVDSYFMPDAENAVDSDDSTLLQFRWNFRHVAPTALKAYCCALACDATSDAPPVCSLPEMDSAPLLPPPISTPSDEPPPLPSAPVSLCAHDDVLLALEACLRGLQDTDWVGLNRCFEHLPPLHGAAHFALAHTVAASDQGTRFHVYTDGSASCGRAAWAFNVLVEFRCGSHLSFLRVGYAGGLLTDDLGPFVPAAMDAEATALIAAAEFLMSRRFVDGMSVAFHFDATSAGFGATGHQNLATAGKEQSERQLAARIMLSLVQRKFDAVTQFHVHAHEGNPWNEFVDGIAWHVCKGWQPPVAAVLAEELPALSTLLAIQTPWPKTGLGDPLLRLPAARRVSAPSVYDFTCVTANVGTMADKAPALARQAEEFGFDVLAFQETRAKHTQMLWSGPYLRLIAASSLRWIANCH
eukprot:Skav230285  [mRNA]  locus=scaffold2091:271759:275102:- [translate_table: standard]